VISLSPDLKVQQQPTVSSEPIYAVASPPAVNKGNRGMSQDLGGDQYRARIQRSTDHLLARLCEHHDYGPVAPAVECPAPVVEERPPVIPVAAVVAVVKEPWFSIVGECDLPRRGDYPSVREIQVACAKHYGVKRHDITSSRRTANVVRPRQVGMYLAKVMTPQSYPQIGRMFGGRDHTTALHAVKKIERLLDVDGDLAAEVATIKSEIGGTYA